MPSDNYRFGDLLRALAAGRDALTGDESTGVEERQPSAPATRDRDDVVAVARGFFPATPSGRSFDSDVQDQ